MGKLVATDVELAVGQLCATRQHRHGDGIGRPVCLRFKELVRAEGRDGDLSAHSHVLSCSRVRALARSSAASVCSGWSTASSRDASSCSASSAPASGGSDAESKQSCSATSSPCPHGGQPKPRRLARDLALRQRKGPVRPHAAPRDTRDTRTERNSVQYPRAD